MRSVEIRWDLSCSLHVYLEKKCDGRDRSSLYRKLDDGERVLAKAYRYSQMLHLLNYSSWTPYSRECEARSSTVVGRSLKPYREEDEIPEAIETNPVVLHMVTYIRNELVAV